MAFQLNKQDKCAARIRDRQLLVLTNDTAEQTDFRTSIKARRYQCQYIRHSSDARYIRHENLSDARFTVYPTLIYRAEHSFKQTIRDM